MQRVVHWPGQEAQKGDAKIPTVIWSVALSMMSFSNLTQSFNRYDQAHNPRAFGAEALSTKTKQQADDDGWELAEHFKLHLHPATMRAEHEIIVQPLPRGVELDRIYSDFFRYLYRHTQDFFQRREVNGEDLWARLESTIEIIIAHPNGWSAYEQGFLRKAAIMGGLVPEGDAAERVHVVSEGEASVHFVMAHGSIDHRFQVSQTRFHMPFR